MSSSNRSDRTREGFATYPAVEDECRIRRANIMQGLQGSTTLSPAVLPLRNLGHDRGSPTASSPCLVSRIRNPSEAGMLFVVTFVGLFYQICWHLSFSLSGFPLWGNAGYSFLSAAPVHFLGFDSVDSSFLFEISRLVVRGLFMMGMYWRLWVIGDLAHAAASKQRKLFWILVSISSFQFYNLFDELYGLWQ